MSGPNFVEGGIYEVFVGDHFRGTGAHRGQTHFVRVIGEFRGEHSGGGLRWLAFCAWEPTDDEPDVEVREKNAEVFYVVREAVVNANHLVRAPEEPAL